MKKYSFLCLFALLLVIRTYAQSPIYPSRKNLLPYYSLSYPPTQNGLSEPTSYSQILANNPPFYLNQAIINNSIYTKISCSPCSGFTITGNPSSYTPSKHWYAKNQPWNADGSKIMLGGSNPAIIDGNSYQFLGNIAVDGYCMGNRSWSNLNKDIFFTTVGCPNTKLVKVSMPNTLNSSVQTILTPIVLKDFSLDGYNVISFGNDEGNISNDDRYIALIGQKNGSFYFIVYDLVINDIVIEKIVEKNPNNITMSPSGQYVVIQWGENGDDNNQSLNRKGTDLYTKDLVFIKHLSNNGVGHYDIGYHQNQQDEYLVIGDDGSNTPCRGASIVGYKLDKLASITKVTLVSNANFGFCNYHISCRNTGRRGFAYISEYASESPYDIVYGFNVLSNDMPKIYQKIFAISIDSDESSDLIEKFGDSFHANTRANFDDTYLRSAMAVPDRQGLRVMFSSDWHNASSPVNSYVVGYARDILFNDTDTLTTLDNSSINSMKGTNRRYELITYPNPATENIIIESENNENNQINIYDTWGRIVFSKKTSQVKETIDIRNWNNGLYLVRVGEDIQKIIVDKK